MTPKKDITIYDIAGELGLSPATVSRGLKDHPAIAVKTRKLITDKAKEMGYRSNNFASNLRRQKSNTIGIIVHELNSNFITSVVAGIEEVSTQAGYDLIIGHSSETYKREIANADNLFHKRVDGLIASLAFDTKDLGHFDPFVRKGIPIVFFDRAEEYHYGTRIVIDNLKAGFEATEHLAKQGCRNIAHITANLTRNVYADRLEGYKQALVKYGLTYNPDFVMINNLGEAAAIDCAQQVLKMSPRPDGVFITNDFFAAVFLNAIKKGGLEIPRDMAIVGFNNDVISKIIDPQLTTIDYPGKEMGNRAAKCLIDQMNGISIPDPSKPIMIPSKLMIRDSSMKSLYSPPATHASR